MIKNRIIYLFILLGLFLFYVFCDSYIPIIAFILLISLTAVSGVFAFASSRKLNVRVSRTGSGADSEKRLVEFCTVVENTSLIPAPLAVFEICFSDISERGYIKRKIKTSAAAFEKKKIYISLSAPYAAYIEENIRRVRVCDSFGIFSFPVRIGEPSFGVLIAPSYKASLGSFKKHSETVIDSSVYSETQKGDDRSQVFEVREYRDGDDMRRIHWSLSSKRDQLIVKEYSKPIEESCTVLLETSLAADSAEETKRRADRLLAQFTALASLLIDDGRFFTAVMYSKKGGRLVSCEIGKYEDIAVLLKTYLSEEQNGEPLASYNAYISVYPSPSAVYYIYDSSAAGGSEPNSFDGSLVPIDTAQRREEAQTHDDI